MTENKTETSESELESVEQRRVPIPAPGIGTRIEEAISRIGSRASAARAAGVSPESLRRYSNESAMPPFDVMASLAETAGVDLHWLATGLGNSERASAEAAAGSVEDSPGDYAIYKASSRIDRDKIASLILLVEQRIADALPQHMKARMAADLIIQYLEGETDESK